MKTILALTSAVAALIVCPSTLRAQNIVFDSFTPPSTFGGFSSANNGLAIQLSVTSDLSITGVSILNEMFTDGDLRFAILSHPEPQFLYLSLPKQFPADAANAPTWKQSDSFDFTFEAGNAYLVGYLRSVDVNDVGDFIAESSGGVTSDLEIHCLSGFSTPSYSHPCISGADNAIRLLAVPEPATMLGLALGLGALARMRRRK